MTIIRRFRIRLNCVRGLHEGLNFCMYCGATLRHDGFFLYHLTSSDGVLDVFIKAVNDHHAKRLYLGQYRRQDLIAQRVPEDAP